MTVLGSQHLAGNSRGILSLGSIESSGHPVLYSKYSLKNDLKSRIASGQWMDVVENEVEFPGLVAVTNGVTVNPGREE